jgi:nitroreductase
MPFGTRRTFLKLITTASAAWLVLRATGARALSQAPIWWRSASMDAMTAIHTRRSIRAFTEDPVSDEDARELLRAAMSAPSAGNEQPWEFVLIRDKATLGQVGAINKYAGFARNAPLAIMTCVNTEREKFPGNGVLDVSNCTQNMLLAAHALGLGAVWTGVYPEQDRMQAFKKLLKLPDPVIPLALVVIGRPKGSVAPENRFKEERIHQETW